MKKQVLSSFRCGEADRSGGDASETLVLLTGPGAGSSLRHGVGEDRRSLGWVGRQNGRGGGAFTVSLQERLVGGAGGGPGAALNGAISSGLRAVLLVTAWLWALEQVHGGRVGGPVGGRGWALGW